MQTDKEFEDFFREQLNGLEETPPPNAWNKINQDLKPRRTWYRETAAIALILLVSVGTYVGYENLSDKQLPENGTTAQVAGTNEQTTVANKETATTFGTKAGQTSSEKTIDNGQPQTSKELLSTISVNEPAETVSEIAIDPTVKTGKNITPISLNGALALVKTNKQTKNTGVAKEKKEINTAEGNAPRATRTTANSLAFAPVKRYAEEAKNSDGKVKSSETNQILARSGTVNNAGTGLLPGQQSSEVKETKTENGTVKGAETTSAQATIAKTDSVALPAIPVAVSDSVQKSSNDLADELNNEESRKFAVMFTFTPGVIARRLIANPNDEKYLNFTEGKGNNPANLGYDLSATFQYHINPQTTLDAGLAYTKLHSKVSYKITTKTLEVVTSPSGVPTASVKVTSTTAEEEIHNEFTYGGLRIGLTQDLGKFANYGFFASTGAGVNMLLQKYGQLHSEAVSGNAPATKSALADNAFHNVNSHLYLNAGIKKEILPNAEFIVAPAFTYYLNSTLRKQQGFELKPYTFGLNFGLRYQF